jgi:hypothetical protein
MLIQKFSTVKLSTPPLLMVVFMMSLTWRENPIVAASSETLPFDGAYNSSSPGWGQGQMTEPTESLQTLVPLPIQNVVDLGFSMTWVFVAVSIIGVISNMFVILVIISSPLLRSQPRNWFIFCQSFADCLSAVYIGTLPTKDSKTLLYVS